MISEKSRKKVRKICIFLPLIVVFSIILILISIFFKHDYANFNFFGMDTFIVVSSDKNIEKESYRCEIKKGRYRDMTKINENYKKLGIDVSKI